MIENRVQVENSQSYPLNHDGHNLGLLHKTLVIVVR